MFVYVRLKWAIVWYFSEFVYTYVILCMRVFVCTYSHVHSHYIHVRVLMKVQSMKVSCQLARACVRACISTRESGPTDLRRQRTVQGDEGGEDHLRNYEFCDFFFHQHTPRGTTIRITIKKKSDKKFGRTCVCVSVCVCVSSTGVDDRNEKSRPGVARQVLAGVLVSCTWSLIFAYFSYLS